MSIQIPKNLNVVYDVFSDFSRQDYMDIFGLRDSSARSLYNISKRSGESLYNILLYTLKKNDAFDFDVNPIEQVYKFLDDFDTIENIGLSGRVAAKGASQIRKEYLTANW